MVSISLLLYEGVYKSVFIHLNFQSFLILDFLLDFSGNIIHPFLLDENILHCFKWFLLHCLLYLFSSNCLAALTSLWSYKWFIWIYELKKKTQRKVFRNLKNEILEETYSRSAFLEYLEKFFNFFCLAPTGGAFMGSVYLLVSPPKKSLNSSLHTIYTYHTLN